MTWRRGPAPTPLRVKGRDHFWTDPISPTPAIIIHTNLCNTLTEGSVLCIYMHMERDSKKIVKRLIAEGFELVSIKGSHHKFRKDGRTVIIPHPKKDLPLGTARSIAKMAGWE
jgi:predicted RNA binding protein YcfA (HicA-like mRNA interferase family)